MTNAEIKAISEVLSYISRMVVDIRADTKLLREAAVIERSKSAQELRRLREKVAKLVAERSSFRRVAAELRAYRDGPDEPHAHTKAVRKDFVVNKNKSSK